MHVCVGVDASSFGAWLLLIFFAFEWENDEGDEATEEIHKKSLTHETH
jgi:hypothetical protein